MMGNLTKIIFYFIVIFSLTGCDNSQFGSQNLESGVKIDNKEILKAREDLIRGMTSYMESSDVSYTIAEVAEAEKILNNHYIKLRDIQTKEEAESLVKGTVIELNHLNYMTNHQLIETDQRELICEFMIKSGAMHGINKLNEDVTERWREW